MAQFVYQSHYSKQLITVISLAYDFKIIFNYFIVNKQKNEINNDGIYYREGVLVWNCQSIYTVNVRDIGQTRYIKKKGANDILA